MKYSLLIIAFVICLKPAFPLLEYAVDYDYISKVLCINKEKPELQCNGKCHLMTQLAEEVPDSENTQALPIEFSVQLVFLENEFRFSIPEDFEHVVTSQQNIFIDQFYSYDFYEELIKPPIV